MKAIIDREGCISCGLCTLSCPEVFQMADDGRAEVCTDPVPESMEDKAIEARDNCPASVISVE